MTVEHVATAQFLQAVEDRIATAVSRSLQMGSGYVYGVDASSGDLMVTVNGDSVPVPATSSDPRYSPNAGDQVIVLRQGAVLHVVGPIHLMPGDGTVDTGPTLDTNTFYGLGAGAAITSGTYNSGFGYHTLASVTSGSENTAIGANAGGANFSGQAALTTGVGNVIIGYDAGVSTSSSDSAVVIGNDAVGNANVSIASTNLQPGTVAIHATNNGSATVLIGGATCDAGNGGDVGIGSGVNLSGGVAIGYQAQTVNSIGGVVIGYQAYCNTAYAVALGYQAAIGPVWSGGAYPTGWGVALGRQATITTGDGAVAIGDSAFVGDTNYVYSPTYSIAIGGSAQCEGDKSIAIGYQARVLNTTTTNSIAIGYGTLVQQSNTIALGNSSQQVQIANNATGTGSASLGANSPAGTLTAPYTWFKMLAGDGTTVYVPAWK